jgi:nucleoside-diphosphate-sugar epimerase
MYVRHGSVLVTGAAGFIGRNFMASLANSERAPARVERGEGQADGSTDWSGALDGVRAVVHLAGRHRGDAAVFDRDVEMTRNLARQVAARGEIRLIHLSSIKVNGDRTLPGQAFCETDVPQPGDLYARAKLRIEQALAEVAPAATVIRAPLVYGPGVKGNFRRLMTLVERGWPVPLGAIENRRTLISTGNLCDFIRWAIEAPHTAGEAFVVSDGEDVSTSALLRRIAVHMGRPSRLFSLPPELVGAALSAVGLGAMRSRLLEDLRVDISKARRFGWAPPLTLEQGLAEALRPGEPIPALT